MVCYVSLKRLFYRVIVTLFAMSCWGHCRNVLLIVQIHESGKMEYDKDAVQALQVEAMRGCQQIQLN